MGEDTDERAKGFAGARDWHIARELAEGIEGGSHEQQFPRPKTIPEKRARGWEEDLPTRGGCVFMVAPHPSPLPFV